MAISWLIQGHDGTELIFERRLAGNMSKAKIEKILQRLVCRHLSEDEVIDASLRKNHSGRTSALVGIGSGSTMHYGDNPHYTAKCED